MGIGGGNDHHYIHISHDLFDTVGNNCGFCLALNNAGDFDGLQFLETADFLLVNVIQLGTVPFACQNCSHALSAGAGTDDRKF